jgi:hypothetical protein
MPATKQFTEKVNTTDPTVTGRLRRGLITGHRVCRHHSAWRDLDDTRRAVVHFKKEGRQRGRPARPLAEGHPKSR